MHPLLLFHTVTSIMGNHLCLNWSSHMGRDSPTFSHSDTQAARQPLCQLRPEAVSVITICHGAVLSFSWVIYCVMAAVGWLWRQIGAWHCFTEPGYSFTGEYLTCMSSGKLLRCKREEEGLAEEVWKDAWVMSAQFGFCWQPKSGFKILFVHVHHGGPSVLARQQAVHLDELQVNNCHLTSQSA